MAGEYASKRLRTPMCSFHGLEGNGLIVSSLRAHRLSGRSEDGSMAPNDGGRQGELIGSEA